MKTIVVIALGLLCVFLPASAKPKNAAAVREEPEVSMVVSGSADLDTNGRFYNIAIDHESKVPIGVVDVVRRSIARLKVELEEESATPRPEKMDLAARVVGRKLDNGNIEIRMKSIHIGEDDLKITPKGGELRKPLHPSSLTATNASGTVYVLARLNSLGEVVEAFAEQVNLHVIASDTRMREVRDALASSAVRGARKWRFDMAGDFVPSSLTVRVPVVYLPLGTQKTGYGQWKAYIPGLRANAPWLTNSHVSADADVVVDGNIQAAVQRRYDVREVDAFK